MKGFRVRGHFLLSRAYLTLRHPLSVGHGWMGTGRRRRENGCLRSPHCDDEYLIPSSRYGLSRSSQGKTGYAYRVPGILPFRKKRNLTGKPTLITSRGGLERTHGRTGDERGRVNQDGKIAPLVDDRLSKRLTLWIGKLVSSDRIRAGDLVQS